MLAKTHLRVMNDNFSDCESETKPNFFYFCGQKNYALHPKVGIDNDV